MNHFKRFLLLVLALAVGVDLCILSALALCFYKALRLITVFPVVSFQALLDISKYTVAISLNTMDGWPLGFINWCAGKGMFESEKAFGIAAQAAIQSRQEFSFL